MKAVSKISKTVLFSAILASLMLAGSAFAQQAIRYPGSTTPNNDFCNGGIGCPDWGESVGISESASIVPVVVTWSVRYFVNVTDIYYVGLDVNGTGCLTGFYGPENLDDISTNPPGHFLTNTFQFVIEPTDGVLQTGTNKFELCGGGNNSGDEITFAVNTLSVVKN